MMNLAGEDFAATWYTLGTQVSMALVTGIAAAVRLLCLQSSNCGQLRVDRIVGCSKLVVCFAPGSYLERLLLHRISVAFKELEIQGVHLIQSLSL